MEEILIRDELLHNIFAVEFEAATSLHLMPEMALRAKVEFAFLQLRMICELIALACLTAHGEVLGAAQLRGSYDADEIIKSLEGLHPDFYPKPSKQAPKKDASGVWRNTPITSGFLTKAELLELYGRCANYLHRGSLKKIQANKSPRFDPWDPKGWADKAWTLLQHHEIQTIHPDVRLVVPMKTRQTSRPQFCYSTLGADGIWRIDADGISQA